MLLRNGAANIELQKLPFLSSSYGSNKVAIKSRMLYIIQRKAAKAVAVNIAINELLTKMKLLGV